MSSRRLKKTVLRQKYSARRKKHGNAPVGERCTVARPTRRANTKSETKRRVFTGLTCTPNQPGWRSPTALPHHRRGIPLPRSTRARDRPRHLRPTRRNPHTNFYTSGAKLEHEHAVHHQQRPIRNFKTSSTETSALLQKRSSISRLHADKTTADDCRNLKAELEHSNELDET